MNTGFVVMLEGEEAGHGYFVSMDVIAPNAQSASTIAQDHARHLGLSIVGVEEVEDKASLRGAKSPGIVKVYGRSFFPSEREVHAS
jgi:hypothetical protein